MTAPARPELAALARRIPPLVRFGASSWNYPGWGGLVYHRTYEGKGTPARMLEEYARFPLFRTVGIDSSFYGPPTDEVLRSYAEHLLDKHHAQSVTLYLVTHALPSPQQVQEGMKLNNPALYRERELVHVRSDGS